MKLDNLSEILTNLADNAYQAIATVHKEEEIA